MTFDAFFFYIDNRNIKNLLVLYKDSIDDVVEDIVYSRLTCKCSELVNLDYWWFLARSTVWKKNYMGITKWFVSEMLPENLKIFMCALDHLKVHAIYQLFN